MNTVIIDDEPDGIENLRLTIEYVAPQLNVIRSFTNPETALSELPQMQVDLVFLDISMPEMSGFEMLESFGNFSFDVIFVTAHREYAIEAYGIGATDYILKPFDHEKIKQVVDRYLKKKRKAVLQPQNNKIAISSLNGIHYLYTSEIIYLTLNNSYTDIFRKGEKPISTKKNLKEFETSLPENFCRIHNSHIVNIFNIKRLIKTDSWVVVVEENIKLPVSRRKKHELKLLLDKYIDYSLE